MLKVNRKMERHLLDTKFQMVMPYQNYSFRDKIYMANCINQVLGHLLQHSTFTDVNGSEHCIVKMKLQVERREMIALAMFVVVTTVEVKCTSFKTAE